MQSCGSYCIFNEKNIAKKDKSLLPTHVQYFKTMHDYAKKNKQKCTSSSDVAVPNRPWPTEKISGRSRPRGKVGAPLSNILILPFTVLVFYGVLVAQAGTVGPRPRPGSLSWIRH